MIRILTLNAVVAALLLVSAPLRAEVAAPRPFALLARCGAYIPLADLNERVEMWVPYLALAFRVSPPADWSRYLVFEIEAGFYAHKARSAKSIFPGSSFNGYRISQDKAQLYAEPVMASVLGNFTVWKGLYVMPGFGAGMMFNQVRGGTSPGSYNQVACAAGIELGYRFTDLISANIRLRAVFSFDRDRVFYHIVPDAGISFHL
jgi:hypothetical protein